MARQAWLNLLAVIRSDRTTEDSCPVVALYLDALERMTPERRAAETDILVSAARKRLCILWARALADDLTVGEIRLLRRGLMAVAVATRGANKIVPLAGWED